MQAVIKSLASSRSRMVKSRLVTEQIGVQAQNPVADGMERPAPERANCLPGQIGDAAHHFAGGLVGEREQQDAVGGNALFQQVRDAVDERAGLAGPGAGDDERGAGRRGDGGELLGVQLARIINLQMDRRKETVPERNHATWRAIEKANSLRRKKILATDETQMDTDFVVARANNPSLPSRASRAIFEL